MLKVIAAAMVALAIAVPAWTGPSEDKALRDAAGCLDGHIDPLAVTVALKRGADPNAPSRTARPISPLGCVALTIAGKSDAAAANREAVEVATILFATGAKLGPADRRILFFPISSGNVEMVRLLIDKGASVIGDLEGYTPTELAKKYGQEAVYQLLVSRGGIPVDSRASAQVAFVEAASNGDVEGMQRAINNGAKINDVDASKQTALVAAVREPIYGPSQGAAIWWLLDHGADPNLEGESKFSDLDGVPLHIFVAMNKNTFERPDIMPLVKETLHRMLAAGAKVSAMDSFDRTPLHVAAKHDNLRAAEILIKAGARVMARDKIGKTPLDYAESAPMIRLLKENGAAEQ